MKWAKYRKILNHIAQMQISLTFSSHDILYMKLIAPLCTKMKNMNKFWLKNALLNYFGLTCFMLVKHEIGKCNKCVLLIWVKKSLEIFIILGGFGVGKGNGGWLWKCGTGMGIGGGGVARGGVWQEEDDLYWSWRQISRPFSSCYKRKPHHCLLAYPS